MAWSVRVSLWNAGVDMLGGGGVVVTTAPRATATIVPWYAYHARIVLPPMSASDEARAVHETFPRLPGWIGTHMGAPHWLGRGMSRDGARIVAVTPYIRADITREVVPGQSGIAITGMAARPDFAAWLTALRSATRWV